MPHLNQVGRRDHPEYHIGRPEFPADYCAVFPGFPTFLISFHPDQILSLFVSYNFFTWSVHQYFHKAR